MNVKRVGKGVVTAFFLLSVWLFPQTVLAALNLAIEANPSHVRPGEQVNVKLTITNNSNSTTGTLTLRLDYPGQLDSLHKNLITTGGKDNTVMCTWTSASNQDICQAGEVVVWDLNALPPWGGVTVSLTPVIDSNAPDNTEINFNAEVQEGVQQPVESQRQVEVLSEPYFELAVVESADPVATDDTLEYTLNYSNVGMANTANTQLILPLPDGTTFIEATGNGEDSSGMVTWDLGVLNTGTGGQQRVRVRIDANEGDLLEVDSASLGGTAGGIVHQVWASLATRVENDIRPGLSISLNPQPATSNEQLRIELTVTNPSSGPYENVELRLRYPEDLDSLHTNLITTGGMANDVMCTWDSASNQSWCQTGEEVVWDLNTIPAGEGVTVSLLPDVVNDTLDGTLISFDAEVRVEDGSPQTQRLLLSGTSFVGPVYRVGYYPGGDFCFPIKAKNGNVAVICL